METLSKGFIVLLSHDVDVPLKYNFIGTLIELNKSINLFLKLKFKESIKLFLKTFHSVFTNKNPYWQFENIMDLEKGYGFRSTFFFCVKRRHKLDPYYNINNKKIVAVIRKLDKEGFEIGLHGSYLSYKNLGYLKEEKRILEKILGKEIIGIRQHFLNFSKDTPKLHEKAGFKYDSSYGFTDKIGYKDNKYSPFYFNELLEIPLVIMDGNLEKMKLSKEQAWTEIKKLIDFAKKNRCLISFNWHQRCLSEKEFPMFANLYKKILFYIKETNAEVLTAQQIYKKWQSR